MNEEQIIEAIQKFFGDTSRTREETKDGLEAVKEHIELLLEAL